MKERIKKMFFMGFRQMQDPYYQGIAAQVAFFFMLSLVPTMILLSQFLRLFHISLDGLAELVELDVTPEFISTLESLLHYDTISTTSIVFLVAAIWAASRIQFTLMRVTTYTYSEGRDPGRYWKLRGRSMLSVILTVLAIVAIVFVLVYGQLVINYLGDKLPINARFDKIWTIFRWPVVWAVFMFVLSLNYYFVLPVGHRRYREVLPGAIFCAIGMVIVTMIYSVYTATAVNNNLVYGSMASIAALMFWFYFISWVLILGILFNKVWKDTGKGVIK